MSRLTLEEIESIKIGEIARQAHLEITGKELGLFELPCWEAIERAQQAIRESDSAVTDLLNDC
jgi:hypothetical protein